MAEGAGQDDLTYILNGFYDNARKKSSKAEPGQVVFAPVLETSNRHLIADAIRANSLTHSEVTLQIREQQHDDFRAKEKRTPVKLLALDEGHELVLSRAKVRPCLVVATASGVDPNSLPAGPQRRLVGRALVDAHVLAPIYSVSSSTSARTFGPIITARIKALMYPNFLYMPQSGLILSIPGVARLDRLFVCHLIYGVELTDLFVLPGVLAVCREQIRILLGESPSAEYTEVREILLSCLPVEAK